MDRPYDFESRVIADRQKKALRLELRVEKHKGRRFSLLADEQPTVTLCQRRVMQEREVAETVTARLAEEVRAGRLVGFFVTIVRPEWRCEGGEIRPELLERSQSGSPAMPEI
jgi:hypothetical protein